MHIEYWICDGCKEIIDNNEKTKYSTPEMGYPFIPKNGGGKHFHYRCLLKYYERKRTNKPSEKELQELIEDAERRHETAIRKKLKKGNLTKKKLEARKATKQDRDELINYFYDYYGIKGLSKKLGTLIDKLNAGEDFDNIRDIRVPYYQLKDMLVYYREELDRAYISKNKKDGFMNPQSRLFYDINIVINNVDDYATRREVMYNLVHNNVVIEEDKFRDLSKYVKVVPIDRERFEDSDSSDIVDEFVKEFGQLE